MAPTTLRPPTPSPTIYHNNYGPSYDVTNSNSTIGGGRLFTCTDCPHGSLCVETQSATVYSPKVECICRDTCDSDSAIDGIVSWVCGSDGNDYRSECDLQRSACREKRTITIHFNGKCGEFLRFFKSSKNYSISSRTSIAFLFIYSYNSIHIDWII